jgi:heat shock protein HslJ
VHPPRRLVLLVVALLLAACGGTGDAEGSLAPLNGDWLLTAGSDADGDIDLGDGAVEVTLTIDGSVWGGQVCNSYSAQDVEVGDGEVRIGDVSRTEMACLDQQLMEAEDRYLNAFVEVTGYEVTADELRLTGEGTELVYAPVPAEADADLVGTVWVLDAVIVGAGPDGSVSSVLEDEATLELREDGTIVASSGCIDREDGTYEVAGDQLVTAFASADDYDCGSDALWAQDTHVWQVLGSDPAVAIDGQRLTLTADDLGVSYAAR